MLSIYETLRAVRLSIYCNALEIVSENVPSYIYKNINIYAFRNLDIAVFSLHYLWPAQLLLKHDNHLNDTSLIPLLPSSA